MNTEKIQILEILANAVRRNDVQIASLTDRVQLDAYVSEVKNGREIWTSALQAALREHEIVVIPEREAPYFIDNTVVIPSNRRIEAHGATVCLTPECDVLMYERFLFQLVPFLRILVERHVLAQRLALDVMVPHIFLFLFELAQRTGADVFVDGLTILAHADLYAATIFTGFVFLCHVIPSYKK